MRFDLDLVYQLCEETGLRSGTLSPDELAIQLTEGGDSIRVRRCALGIESVARARRGAEARSATQGTDDSVFGVFKRVDASSRDGWPGKTELRSLRRGVGAEIRYTARWPVGC
jgi:hypothetical protein